MIWPSTRPVNHARELLQPMIVRRVAFTAMLDLDSASTGPLIGACEEPEYRLTPTLVVSYTAFPLCNTGSPGRSTQVRNLGSGPSIMTMTSLRGFIAVSTICWTRFDGNSDLPPRSWESPPNVHIRRASDQCAHMTSRPFRARFSDRARSRTRTRLNWPVPPLQCLHPTIADGPKSASVNRGIVARTVTTTSGLVISSPSSPGLGGVGQ
jgi:hypothetical protein